MADVKANKPFRVRMANFTNHPVILRNNHVLGIAARAPSTLLAVDVDRIFPDQEGKTGKQKPTFVSPGLLAGFPPTPSGEAGEPSDIPAASMVLAYGGLCGMRVRSQASLSAPFEISA